MPYSERVAEAFINAKDNPSQQDKIVREGQFAIDPRTGESTVNPKYRVPTKEEADMTVDTMKMGNALIPGMIGLVSPATGIGLAGLWAFNDRRLEEKARNEAYIPVYKNWDYEDWKGQAD